ncbi:ABC1 kinase family protein [Aromatoleum diolicum]|uniref:Ubiquinone biosynthesis protein UbiB n=1 Tax=Aromatoleum diolicum TaxID=75796 RepID=A0ABX1QAK7_9RHOO|nr:AarF/UbiB family protein [Aromatoleum diolicum]NMG74555.1 ubiquinone biosynthesis protein UbiB [Aromatoleum diolicum]
MFWQAIGAARDLARAHDIAAVLIRYGFGDLVRRIGMAEALERAGKALHWRAPEELARLEPPARVRRALEELGPTFIKLGQILATRVDLFAPEWIAEFGKLQDAAPAVPFATIRAQLAEDLGEDPATVFAALETSPLAAASLAQVHRARLADGREVVLKVRRPGIRPTVEADLHLLARLAEIIDAEAPDLRRYRPREVVQEFTHSLRRELDFAAECRNAERIAARFVDQPHIVVPAIHWQWCGERLNVQDYVDGIPGHDMVAADAAGLDRKLLARRGAAAVLKMMLQDGFFHADPHPGNVFYLPDNCIAFIDFGMVGRLSETRRYELALLLHGLVSHQSELVARVLLDWRSTIDGDADADPARLRAEIDAFVDQYSGVPLKQLDLGAMLTDLVAILREHGLALPPDLSLLVKAFITLEGMGRQLDPGFDMGAEAAPFLRRVLLAHNAPAALAKRGWRALSGTLDVLAGLPQDLSEMLRAGRRGKLQIQVEVVSLKRFGEQLDRAASRMTIGIVTAALIIGSAIVMTVVRDPALAGLRTFGLLGFLGAAVGGIWVLLSIWRGRKG